jgi:hypothetical protein
MSNRNKPAGGLRHLQQQPSDSEDRDVELSDEDELEEEEDPESESCQEEGNRQMTAALIQPTYGSVWVDEPLFPSYMLAQVAKGLSLSRWMVYPKDVATILNALAARWERGGSVDAVHR